MGLLLLFLIAAALVCVGMVAAVRHRLRHPPRKTYAAALARGLPVEPTEAGLRGEAITLTLADGARSPGWLIEGDAPVGPTIVMLHGFGDSRYGELLWAPLLTPHASELVLFDQRGQGESEAPTAQGGIGEARDVLTVLDQIDAPHGIVLFGYSMGAGIAIAAAAQEGESADGPGRILGVIADGPYRQWDEPLHNLFRRRRYPRQPVLWLTGLLLRWTVPGFAEFDRADLAARLRCPLLVLHGCDDPVCPLDAAQRIAAAAPQGELVEFEEGRHLDLARNDEPRYREALARFFARLGGCSA